jgi:hypothetical protein
LKEESSLYVSYKFSDRHYSSGGEWKAIHDPGIESETYMWAYLLKAWEAHLIMDQIGL